MVLDAFAEASKTIFEDKRYGYIAQTTYKGRKVFLLKPTTYMNLSGNAVRYWLEKENIPNEHLLVISDDVALPLGTFRLKASGNNGGHNGLGHIQQLIGNNYPRLRMGIGNNYPHGAQADYVLGNFTPDEQPILQTTIQTAVQVIQSYIFAGINNTMNQYNQIGKTPPTICPTPQD